MYNPESWFVQFLFRQYFEAGIGKRKFRKYTSTRTARPIWIKEYSGKTRSKPRKNQMVYEPTDLLDFFSSHFVRYSLQRFIEYIFLIEILKKTKMFWLEGYVILILR